MHAAFMADEIWGFLLEHQLVCMSRGESIFIVSGTYLAHTTLSRNSRIVCALVCNKDILYNPAQSGYVQMSRKKSTQPPPAWLGSAGRPRVKQTLLDACDAPPLPNNTQMHAEWSQDGGGLFILYAYYVGSLRVSKCTVATSRNNHCWRSNWVFLPEVTTVRITESGHVWTCFFFSNTPADRRFFFVFSKTALHSNANAMRLTCERYWSAVELWLRYYDMCIPRH